jgi:uncharacterized membrane protein YgcG
MFLNVLPVHLVTFDLNASNCTHLKMIYKNFIKVLISFIFVVSFSLAHAESITNFTADYEVREDGTVQVTEVISYDFGPNDRHGIFRILKNEHPQEATAWYKKRFIDIELLSVGKDGGSVPYEVTEFFGDTTIKVGDADVTIQGQHTYTISYLLSGALSYGPLGAEFYYDVTGNSWEVPIERVTATVRGVRLDMLSEKAECYKGVESNTLHCEKNVTPNETAFVSEGLSAYEGVTIAQSLKADMVSVLIREDVSLGWVGYVAGLLWLVWVSIVSYRRYTKNKVDLPVIAQYESYEGVLPMYAGVLFDSALDPQDITAGIVYLAQQGFIKIKRTEEKVLWVFNTTDYELTLLKPVEEVKVPMLVSLLSLLFGTNAAVSSTVRVSELAKEKVQNAVIIQKLRTDVVAELQKDGFLMSESFSSLPWKRIGIFAAVSLWACLYINPGFVLVISFLSALVYGLSFIKRKTKKGYEAVNHMKGLKLFLSVTEKERYTFFNAPAKSPELFMHFLPYAIAFKVEKEWAEAFAGITIASPDWYEGGNFATFSAVSLSQDIGAFSSSFASSSGTQGSSGGGSSGGGGGGGGGGSW